MSNKNSKNLNSCNYCYSCNSCNSCNSCYSCNYCDSCNSCNYCDSCNSCYFCVYLRMSEKMIFCLGEGKFESKGIGYQKNLMIFNKSVTEEEYKKVENALDIKNFKLPIAKWVKSEDMTEEEKDNWTSHNQTGGFLKTLSYKDAWKEMWANLSQGDKDFFKGIINFDAEIFENITGIKVEGTINEEIITLNGKNYKRID